MKGRCPFRARFYGLIGDDYFEVDEDSREYEETIYEEVFQLSYFGDSNITEAWNLPVALRRWFMKRTAEEKEEEAKQAKKQQGKQSFDPGSSSQ